MRYQSAMDAQRYKQSKLVAASKYSIPHRKTPLDLEIHASEFQSELIAASFDCGLQNVTISEDMETFCIIDRRRNNRWYMVEYDKNEKMAACSCKMFETEDILCRHCLWMFKEKEFKSLPTFYIISRWQKNAMSIPIFDLGGNLIEETSKMDEVKKKVGDLWAEIFSCLSLAKKNEESLDEFIDVIKTFK
ncbi:Protein FAR1-RELATED SEQUENCE 5 [Bienertia sinuspersici]